MALNTKLLDQQLKQLQQWVDERMPSADTTTSIQSALRELRRSLHAGQPILNIVSADPIQSQAFLKLLNYGNLSPQQFVTYLAALPHKLDGEIVPNLPGLILQNDESPMRYELSCNSRVLLGRNPHQAKILLADHRNLVSGIHAELQPMPQGGWQVQDCNSRNGTYINGQRLQGWHRLEGGDRLCLGSATEQEGSATLVYDPPNPVLNTTHFSPGLAAIYPLLNCNALCLVVDLSQPFSSAAQHLLNQAAQIPLQATFVIATMPRGAAPEAVKIHLAEMREWLDRALFGSTIQLVPLPLEPVLLQPGAIQMTPHQQPEFERLCQRLVDWAAVHSEEMTVQRVAKQTQIQFAAIESALKQQVLVLKRRVQHQEAQLQSLTSDNHKEQFSKTWTRISAEKDQFFRQMKSELSQSKANLLDEFRRRGLPATIKKFVKRLKSVVVDQGGYCHVRLRLTQQAQANDSPGNVHLEALQLCRSQLANWALEEWQQICTVHGSGGLRSLLQRSYDALNALPNLKLPPERFALPELPDPQSILQVSVVEPPSGIRYKQSGLLGYLFKNVKGRVISGVALFMLVVGAVLPEVPQRLKAQIAGPMLIFFTLSLFWSYRQEKGAKVEEVTEKLQKEMIDHYCSLSRSLTERLVQHLNFILDGEERRLRDTLETAKERFTTALNDLEKHQSYLKTQLEEGRKLQQRMVSKDMPELQQLQRSLLNSLNEQPSARAEVSRRFASAAKPDEKRPAS